MKNYRIAVMFNISQRMVESLRNIFDLDLIVRTYLEDKKATYNMRRVKALIRNSNADDKDKDKLIECLNGDYKAEYLKNYMDGYQNFIEGEDNGNICI